MSESTTRLANAPGEKQKFPPGMHNAYWFASFNPLSYQIILGSPMILYAKTLGASATIIGVIAGMMPLLVIFQIPAANHINRIGYRRFVLAGWGTRVLFIFGMALVPLAGAFLDARNRLALLLVLLFFFNLVRGISSCAWLPWLSQLVPATLRGKYLSRDVALQNFASFIAFLVAAGCLAGQTRPWQFAVVFAFSAVMGAASLIFLKRIPDVEIPESARTSQSPVPWLEMLKHSPFKKLLRAVIGWSVAYGGLTAFTVAYLKVKGGMDEGEILLVTSISFIGGLSSLWFLGHALDRLGSKPVMSFCCIAWLLVLAGWVVLSGDTPETGLLPVLALQFFMGLLAALLNMSSNRLAMATIPAMGRNHFFALYSVLSNLALGLAPILWGLLIDSVGEREFEWLGLLWNRYTVFFAAAALVFATTFMLARGLEEPQAASMDELLREILIQNPQRFWLRFWPRG
jgi:MFS family permease